MYIFVEIAFSNGKFHCCIASQCSKINFKQERKTKDFKSCFCLIPESRLTPKGEDLGRCTLDAEAPSSSSRLSSPFPDSRQRFVLSSPAHDAVLLLLSRTGFLQAHNYSFIILPQFYQIQNHKQATLLFCLSYRYFHCPFRQPATFI